MLLNLPINRLVHLPMSMSILCLFFWSLTGTVNLESAPHDSHATRAAVPPTIVTQASDIVIDCFDEVALNQWLDSNAGAVANSECGAVTWENNWLLLWGAEGPVVSCDAPQTFSVTFTVTDDCGGASISTSASVTVANAVMMAVPPPQFLSNGGLCEVDLDPSSTGYPTVTFPFGCDGGTDLIYTDEFLDGSEITDGCFVMLRHWTASCGDESVTEVQELVVSDDVAPTILGNVDFGLSCDVWNAGGCTYEDLHAAGAVTAGDNCTLSHVDVSCEPGPAQFSCAFIGGIESYLVEYSAHDVCGNSTVFEQQVCIIDDAGPVWTLAPPDFTLDCLGSAPFDSVTTVDGHLVPVFLPGDGQYAEAQDNCDLDPEVSYSDIIVTWPTLPDTIMVVRTWTALDESGNQSTHVQWIAIPDNAPPDLITPAADLIVECAENSSYFDWLDSHGGAEAFDECGELDWEIVEEEWSPECGETGSKTVTFTAIDPGGLSVSTTATFTLVDTEAPMFMSQAEDLATECWDSVTPQTEAWFDSHGGAQAWDACSNGNLTWETEVASSTPGCGSTQSLALIFTVSDECGNSASTSALFETLDTSPPFLAVPAEVEVDCNGFDIMDVSNVTALDVCNEAGDADNVSLSVVVDAAPESGCGGVWQRTVTAEDGCGNHTTQSQTITVVDNVPPTIDIIDEIPTLELMATSYRMKQWHELWLDNEVWMDPDAFAVSSSDWGIVLDGELILSPQADEINIGPDGFEGIDFGAYRHGVLKQDNCDVQPGSLWGFRGTTFTYSFNPPPYDWIRTCEPCNPSSPGCECNGINVFGCWGEWERCSWVRVPNPEYGLRSQYPYVVERKWLEEVIDDCGNETEKLLVRRVEVDRIGSPPVWTSYFDEDGRSTSPLEWFEFSLTPANSGACEYILGLDFQLPDSIDSVVDSSMFEVALLDSSNTGLGWVHNRQDGSFIIHGVPNRELDLYLLLIEPETEATYEVKIPDLSIPPCPENLHGCTYPEASNYDPISDYDDGSCTFSMVNPCPTDLNGNGITDTPDILQLLGNFGFPCPD